VRPLLTVVLMTGGIEIDGNCKALKVREVCQIVEDEKKIQLNRRPRILARRGQQNIHELEAEQVSSGSQIFLLGVGEIAQHQCRPYSELSSLFRPVPQLKKKNIRLRDLKTPITHHLLVVSLKE
jgi:hypothetical protein